MKVCFRRLTVADLKKWETLAKDEFNPEDFCTEEYLLKDWKNTEGWILFDSDTKEWIGCCFVSYGNHKSKLLYNPDGVVFLEICTFPKFRGKGFGKHLLKIMFLKTVGYKKNTCINPSNAPSIALFTKYGFKKVGPHKNWDVYISDDRITYNLRDLHLHECVFFGDTYPEEN